MKYLKYFESDTSLIYSSLIMDLKDMSLELVDDGFKVEVYTNETAGEFLVVINKQNSVLPDRVFMMDQNLKDFILRSTNYMKLEGYKSHIHSDYGTLSIIDENIFIKNLPQPQKTLDATNNLNYAITSLHQFTTINISFILATKYVD